MLAFEPTGRVSEAGLSTPLATAVFLPAADHTVTLIQYGRATSVAVSLAEGALAWTDPPQPHGTGRVALGSATSGDSLLPQVYEAVLGQAQNSLTEGITTYLTPGGQALHQGVALAAEHAAGDTLLYVGNTQGLAVYQITGAAPPSLLGHVQDNTESYGADIACMARVGTFGGDFLITGSMGEHGLNVYNIGARGLPVLIGRVGVDELLPVAGVSALVPVEVAGRVFLVAAASGTSSLTVLEMHPDGTLTPTDHLLDTRATRFEGATHLAVFEHAGHNFVLAAGQDDGLSLFALLPDGQLVHLQSLADSTATGLENISALTVQVVGAEAQVFVLSAVEAGLTQLTLDLSGLGAVRGAVSGILNGTEGQDILCLEAGGSLLGGGGNDLLRDGQGENTLTGGAGQDVFVFVADGAPDVITDFDPDEDRLDLSMIPRLYDPSQLEITPQAYGAILRFGEESWHIHTADNSPLTIGPWSDIGSGHRVVVTLGPAEPPATGTTHTGNNTADLIHAGAGDDTVLGRGGDDTLIGNAGRDTIFGGDGADRVSGGTGQDLLRGGGGDDLLTGDLGADRLFGDRGNDTLMGGNGTDVLYGGYDNDLLRGGGDADTLNGELGSDTLFGDRANDQLFGGNGADFLYGGYEHDFMRGGGQNDVLHGELGNDRLFGDRGDDRLFGGNNEDMLYGGYDNDLLHGGASRDTLNGELGNDTLHGDRGNDRVLGGHGDDHVYGDFDHDFVHGGAGNDVVNGGFGNDTLGGGLGRDTFVFAHGFGVDVITDFDAALGERIDFSRLDSITNMTDLMGDHATQVGDDVVIADLLGNTLTLRDVALDSLEADNFLF